MDLVIASSELTMCILLLHYIFCSRIYLLYSECVNIQNVEKYLNLKQSLCKKLHCNEKFVFCYVQR